MSTVATATGVLPPPPTCVILCGPPCSGKTTIARGLADRPSLASFAYFEMDELRLALFPGSNTPEDRAKAYARMHDLAADAIRAGGRGAILVATYQPSQQRHAVRAMAEGLPARLLVFECKVSPSDAVQRFYGRNERHAATDLSPERVWDLAHDFPYCSDAITLDTSAGTGSAELIAFAESCIRPYHRTAALDAWTAEGSLPHGPVKGHAVSLTAPLKLTARSQRRVTRRWLWHSLLFGVSAAGCAAAFLVLGKEVAALLVPSIEGFGLPGDAADWIQGWGVVAVLASGLLLLYEQLFEREPAKKLKAARETGRTPRLSLRHGSPSNSEVFRRYKRRVPCGLQDFLRIPEVPLWFAVLPRVQGFDVVAKKAARNPVDEGLLQYRAAGVGLDWAGYCKWRERELMDEYYDRYHEVGVRVLDIEEPHGADAVNDVVYLKVCQGSFVSHVCTELSANLHREGRYGFELREILEGPGWIRARRSAEQIGDGVKLDLDPGDLRQSSKTFEMLVGVQAALTTADGYLLLQRRSHEVQSAGGGVVASGAGGAQWKDLAGKQESLIGTALRELKEEIGWVPHPYDNLTAPFLGAAYNLLRGRDLNFYCHFHTHWFLHEISAGWPRLRNLSKRKPLGTNRARDRWEVAHIIPVPLGAVSETLILEPPYNSILGESRHVRGVLYCLARSAKFRDLQARFPS